MLTVAMIGRDEAHCVSRALESVAPYADEIVFVDTGSTDATPEIARRFGARIFEQAWGDDFSAARNFALDRCSGDWVLSIDCDEIIVPSVGTTAFVDTLKAENKEIAFIVEIQNHLVAGTSESHSNIRLFKNTPKIRFTNPVHESVSSSVYELTSNKTLRIANFHIDHFGYQSAQRNKEKIHRNLKLLARWIETDAENPYAWYKFGLSLTSVSRDRGIACLFKAYELLAAREDRRSYAYRFELVSRLVSELEKSDPRLSRAVRVSSQEFLAAEPTQLADVGPISS